MDLTQMFLASPDWVKGLWVVCFTLVVLGIVTVFARWLGTRTAESAQDPVEHRPPPVRIVTSQRLQDPELALEAEEASYLEFLSLSPPRGKTETPAATSKAPTTE